MGAIRSRPHSVSPSSRHRPATVGSGCSVVGGRSPPVAASPLLPIFPPTPCPTPRVALGRSGTWCRGEVAFGRSHTEAAPCPTPRVALGRSGTWSSGGGRLRLRPHGGFPLRRASPLLPGRAVTPGGIFHRAGETPGDRRSRGIQLESAHVDDPPSGPDWMALCIPYEYSSPYKRHCHDPSFPHEFTLFTLCEYIT